MSPRRMKKHGKPCHRVKGYTRVSCNGKKHHVKAYKRCN